MSAPSIFDNIDLTGVALPTVIEEPQFEVLLEERVADFTKRDPNYKLLLESDPAVKVLEAAAYRELILRQRINHAVQQTMLAFGSGDSLDRCIGDFWQVERMLISAADNLAYPPIPAVWEDDQRYRLRLQLRAGASSCAGTPDHYRYHAMSADVLVEDVRVYSANHYPYYNTHGQVNVAVLSSIGNKVPSQEMLDNVTARLTDPSIKVLTDIIVVEAATLKELDIRAEVYLLPRTPLTVFNALEANLRAAFATRQALGWDVTKSWLTKQLQADGVHSVVLIEPTTNLKIAPNEFPSLDTVTLVFKGFSDTEIEDVQEMERRRLISLMYKTYIDYAVGYRRTPEQIAEDLTFREKDGVVQPTIHGLVAHLQLAELYTIESVLNVEEIKLAKVIWYHLAKIYGYLPPGTTNVIL